MPKPKPPRVKPRILVADDLVELLSILRETLENEGFDVETASNGRDALEAIKKRPPDIAILDLKMPIMDGFDVCRELRQDPLFEHLPIIILTASATRDNKVEGLNLGADDFIAKPVDMTELLARVRMILRRTRQVLDANPLSHLPGNVSIERRIEEALAAGKPLAVLYVDLNQFKAYNDAYGYDSGDRVIKRTADMLIRLTREGVPASGHPSDFVGHIGGDDFIVLTDPARMEALAMRIITEFDAMAPAFYSDKDRRRGRILSTDRQGRVLEFPLLSMSIGICHNGLRPLSSYAEIARLGSELKHHAKANLGSAYVVDRRRA